MSANYNAVLTASLNDNQANYTVTTSSGTTGATGSSMYVVIAVKTAETSLTPTVTDNFGNTYSQIGSTITDGQNVYLYRFLAKNIAGGTAHTVTVANPSYATGTVTATTSTTIVDSSKTWTTNQWNTYNVLNTTRSDSATVTGTTAPSTLTFSSVPGSTAIGDSYIVGALKMTVVAIELTGCNTTNPLDLSTTFAGDYSLPKSLPSQTLGSEAAQGAVLISAFELLNAVALTYTVPTGFTSLYASGNTNNFPNNINFCVAIQVIAPSAAGTYTPAWNTSPSNGAFMSACFDSFIGATAAAAALATSLGGVANVTPALTTAGQFPTIPLLTNLTPANTGLSQTPQTVGGYLNTAFGYLNSGRTVFNNEVTYSLTANVDSPTISGDAPGFTNSYVITPSAGGFTLNGLITASTYAMQNGFTRMITNGSGTYSFTLGHETSATTQNRFICPSGTSVTVPPYGTVVLRYSTVLIGSTVK